MDVMPWPAPMTMATSAVVAAGMGWLVARIAVPRLPEPLPEPDDPFTKPLYAQLPRRRLEPVVVILALLAGAVAPRAGALGWAAVALAGLGAALVGVDLLTTYLPTVLQRSTAVAVVLAGLAELSGAPGSERSGLATTAAAALGGALASGLLFWLLWRLGDGFGYGDVRLASLVGGFAGALGVGLWWTALVAGTAVGALCAVAVALWRRRHPSALGTGFPYGPALWSGPFIALAMA